MSGAGPRKSWQDWYLVAVLIGFIGFCLGPAMIGLRTLLPVDWLTNYYPWMAGSSDAAGHDACSGDTIDSVMPGIAHVRAELFSGHLPNWQGFIGGGSVLGNVPDLGLLDPLSLPYFVLPLWLAPAFVVLLSFVAGIGGTFLFLRRLQVSRPGAMLAGMIFATSGFMVMWSNWPQTRVAALIPALFWATERLIQRVRALEALLIALVLSSMLLGGFPAVTGFALYLAAGYFLFRMIQRYRFTFRSWWRTTGLAIGGVALGALLSMVQLLPFVVFYNQENFANRSAYGNGGLPLSSLITTVAPNAYGLCIFGEPNHAQVNAVEEVAYVGAAALVLAVAGAAFGMLRDRRQGGAEGARETGRGEALGGVVGYFVVASVVIVLLGWGPTLFRDLTKHLPVFSNNFIGRIRSVLGFMVAALAGVGFDRLTTGTRGPVHIGGLRDRLRSRQFLWAVLVWATAGIAGFVILWRARHGAIVGGYWHDLANASWVPLALLVVVVALVVASRFRPHHGQTVLFILLPALVAAQGAQFVHTVLPGDSKKNFYPNTGAHKFLEKNLGHDRFASSGGTMYPSTALYYGLRTPTGHTFQEPAWVDLLKAVDPSVMATYTFSDFTGAVNQFNAGYQPILDQMAVKYFVLPPSDLIGTTKPLPPANGSVELGGATTASCTLPGQPLRGVRFQLARALVPDSAAHGATISVTIRADGRVLSSGRYQDTQLPAGTVYAVAIAGEDLSAGGKATITVSETGARGGVALATQNGAVICSPVTPPEDHLKLVYADSGSVIYQRLTALARIRWASRSVVMPAPAMQVSALKAGVPPGEVLLDRPASPASGQGAAVSVESDSGDQISAKVDARGAGYLVVADALQQRGWSVTVDGRPATLVPADHAMVAVAVPQGTHTITLRYRAPGQKAGAVLTGVALVVAALILGSEWRRRRARRLIRHTGPPPVLP